LENPGGLDPGGRAARTIIGLMASFFRAGARRAAWFPRAFRVYYRSVLTEAPATEQRDRIVAAAYELAPILAQTWDGFRQPASDIRSLIPSVRCPVLFAWATRDRFVSLRRNRAAIESFSDVRLIEYRAGHSAHLEAPDEFEAAVRHFLQSVATRDPLAASRGQIS
jgi:4,5:9,10-diseco-3-hydroxy-5,9,17-trioxoandrosta-1(10),2-diene-4-oate hydrolase